MIISRRLLAAGAAGAASALLLAGCAGTPSSAPDSTDDSGTIAVVASTNVYAQIAEEIGGDHVDVTAIISSTGQDPHSFEPSARDQLAVSEAQLILENGGGYDAFMDALIEATGTEAPVITAAEFSHDWPGDEDHADDEHADDEHADDEHADEESAEEHADDDGHGHVEGFNEHVWYDPETMEHFAEAIADELAHLDPDNADVFSANLDTFAGGLTAIQASLADLDAEHGGTKIVVTEPVPLYLTTAAGLVNVMPEEFTEAVEEGQDVPPAVLLEALTLLSSGDVRVVIANAQTGGAETLQVISEAEAQGLPVLEFAETLPEGQTYLSWMQANVDALAGALTP